MKKGAGMGVRRQAREAALQAMFMCDFLSDWRLEVAEFCLDHFASTKSIRSFASSLCKGAIENLDKIDSSLTCASEHWSLNRMGRVDRAILRVSTFELLFLADVPVNVAINEAIEISKRYGSEESPQFVNGVLDRVAAGIEKRSAERAGRAKIAKLGVERVSTNEESASQDALKDNYVIHCIEFPDSFGSDSIVDTPLQVGNLKFS